MRIRMWLIIAVAACLFTGCSFRTVDQMYCLPKRPEAYDNFQSAMDSAMTQYEYCAPLSGENQQTVQMADLDGDGVQEYLLFAKCNAEMPLQILIFQQEEENFVLADVIESNGSAFDLVEYVQMDSSPGLELVVGRQVSDQVVRSLSVYRFSNGQAEQVLSANYSKFLTCDMDSDDVHELLIFRPGQADTDPGITELFSVRDGVAQKSNEVSMSQPVDKLKRILIGNLHGGTPAVFAGSSAEESAIITDIYALCDGQLRNVAPSGASVNTLRNQYIYAEDIDGDGVMELPSVISMIPMDRNRTTDRQYLIRWYSVDTEGKEIDKLYTYHNYVSGWYMVLDSKDASRICVQQDGSAYQFYLWDSSHTDTQQLYSIFVFTGNNRQELALQEQRFILHRGDAVVYAAQLHPLAVEQKITPEDLVTSFHLIHQDWKTGEM